MTGDTWDEFAARLRAEHGWTDAGIVVWGRAGCRCEYCDADLLECRAAYKAYQYDHILPQSQYKQLYTEPTTANYGGRPWLSFTGHGYSNIALSCGGCNTLKSTWDPHRPDVIVDDSCEDLSPSQRAELVARTRAHLRDRVSEQLRDLALARRWSNSVRGGDPHP